MMSTLKQPQIQRRARRGQSIVVALLVLLLLGLVGALFVTVVARNLINTGKIARVQTAGTYAHAGITYADAQISSSADGADWRPPLQFALLNPPTEARELARYTANTPPPANAADPDLEYLQVGFARYNTGAGRFLVRVTYDPVNIATAAVPPGKYLKIESIGREGVIDPLDPTTYSNNRSTDKTQSYEVAYKPIGITDYARFETNPDKRSDIANLGVVSQFYAANTDGGIATPGVFDFYTSGTPPVVSSPPTLQEYPVITTYGAADAYIGNPPTQPNPAAGSTTTVSTVSGPTGFTPGGGSIHANMPVRFFGTNVLYLNPSAGASAPLFQDTTEIAGDVLLDSYNDANPLYTKSAVATAGQQAALVLNPDNSAALTAIVATTPDATKNAYIVPSNGTTRGFDTHQGLIRDGSMQNDAAGRPRSITRLEPPLLDAQDTASQMPRYRAIAMNSAPRTNVKNPDGTAYTGAASPSPYGYGKAIYVNNPQDVQPDSTSIGGGSTLTDEWLHRTATGPNSKSFGDWNGLFYDPPGVSVILGQFIPAASGPGSYGIRLVRSTDDHFVGPNGVTNAGQTMDVKYSDLDTDRTGAASDNDIVIYAEGNVRVRGIASPNEGTSLTPPVAPRHITIVTGGTAYIEGNLLKGSPDSSISVLAHDYVCINTTQFLAGTNVEDRSDGSQNPVQPPFGNTLTLDAEHSLLQEFNFGLTGTDNPTTKYHITTSTVYPLPLDTTKLALYIATGPAAPGSTTADIDIFNSSGASIFTPTPLGPQAFQTFTQTTYDLSSFTSLSGALGTDLFHLTVSKDNGQENANGVVSLTDQDVALERVAILPMDIRIEAVLYAQTRSFFVIPGEWFNTRSLDNLDAYTNSFLPLNPDGTPINPNGLRPSSDRRFPLYGQPIDLKITIDGSVSEAHPADIAAQTEWMRRWGWIPQYHGSLVTSAGTEPAGHRQKVTAGQPAIGLQIIYDPQAGYPYNPTKTYYLRSDKYGRPLPFTPKLPVSPGLLYSGQSGEAPLLQ